MPNDYVCTYPSCDCPSTCRVTGREVGSAAPLGYCTKCDRMRWLQTVTHDDASGNPYGICRSCFWAPERARENNDSRCWT